MWQLVLTLLFSLNILVVLITPLLLAAAHEVPVIGSPCRHHSHTLPRQADFQLTEWLTKLQALGIAPSTRHSYQSSVKHHLHFCTQHKISPLPAYETTLRYFCAHLSHSTAHPTIKVYLAGIRLLYTENVLLIQPRMHLCCTTSALPSGDQSQHHQRSGSLLQHHYCG